MPGVEKIVPDQLDTILDWLRDRAHQIMRPEFMEFSQDKFRLTKTNAGARLH